MSEPCEVVGSGGNDLCDEILECVAYEHTWGLAASVILFSHPLLFKPNVAVQDSTGREVDVQIEWPTANTVRITGNAPFVGTAHLS